MRHKTKNPLLETLLAMNGQDNVITVHRPIVKFLDNSLEGAMLLSQLLYWTPRSSNGGWIAKSDKEFQDELCLTRYSIRAANKLLSDRSLIETQVRKFYGFPTKHYRVILSELEKQWISFLRLSENEQTIVRKRTNLGLSENEQTLTETTQRLPHNKRGFFKAFQDVPKELHPYFEIWIPELGEPTGKEINDWKKTFDEFIKSNISPKQSIEVYRKVSVDKSHLSLTRPGSIKFAFKDKKYRAPRRKDDQPKTRIQYINGVAVEVTT